MTFVKNEVCEREERMKGGERMDQKQKEKKGAGVNMM